MKKAMIFTIEAMIGLMILTIFLISIYNNISESRLPEFSDNYLFDISNDVLILLRQSGTIDKVIETGNPTPLEIFLNNLLPYHVCSIIEISDSSDSRLYLSFKSGCVMQDQKVVSVFASEVVDDQTYYINIQSWISLK